MKTKVGHEWYQFPALALLVRHLYLFNIKEHHFLMYIKLISAFNDHKN
jgi:hypothetical protein